MYTRSRLTRLERLAAPDYRFQLTTGQQVGFLHAFTGSSFIVAFSSRTETLYPRSARFNGGQDHPFHDRREVDSLVQAGLVVRMADERLQFAKRAASGLPALVHRAMNQMRADVELQKAIDESKMKQFLAKD